MSSDEPSKPTEITNEQWREKLDPESFAVLRESGTEPAFSGAYNDEKGSGMFRCKGCNAKLFASDTKFDSGSGWPSFTDPVVASAVTLVDDNSHGMRRTEATCACCGGHLGHVFDDGPGASGQRWCINSAALDFEPQQ